MLRASLVAILVIMLRRVRTTELAILLLAVLVWAGAWFLVGWQTLASFGVVLTWCGIAAITYGAFGVSSARGVVGDMSYQSQCSTRRDGVETHRAYCADRAYLDSRVVEFLTLLLAGGAAVAVGEWLRLR